MKHIVLALALLIGFKSVAQKKEKAPKESVKYLYKETTVETDDYKVYIVDAIAVGDVAKFKIKIFNKTNDYLLVKPSEFTYVVGDKKILSRDKTFVVAPNEEESEVIDFKGTEMQAEKFTVEIKGIYKASAGGKIATAANFALPPTQNEFTAGNFTCTLKKSDSKTDKTVARFECVYTGDGVGIINPYKTVVIMPNEKENPNSKKSKPTVLEKGKRDDFTLVFNEVAGAGDMQKKTIQIKWGETFRESKLILLGSANLELVKESEKK